VRATEVYRRYVATRKLPWLEGFVKDTGLDPRQDLWEFLAVSNGKDAVLMARGKFSPMGLEPKLERAGVPRTPYKGYTIIGDERVAVAFTNATTAIAGKASALRAIIDQRSKSGGIPAPLLDQLKSVPPGSQVWFVSQQGFKRLPVDLPKSGALANIENLNRVLGTLESGALSIDLRTGLDAQASGVCATGQDAKRLHDALRGLIGLGRLSTPASQPELLQFYDAFVVSQHERTVNIKAAISLEQLAAFEKMFEQGFRGLPRPRL